MPSSKSLMMYMYIGLHGDLTPELVVAFLLSFIPELTNHQQHYSQLRIVLNVPNNIALDATNKLLRNISLSQGNVLIRNEHTIGIENTIFSSQL